MDEQMALMADIHGGEGRKKYPYNFAVKTECVSEAFRYLLEQKNMTVTEVSKATGLPAASLYNISSRHCDRADMRILKVLADYFQEDLSIFCGIEFYTRPKELGKQEQEILKFYRKLNPDAKKRAYDTLSDISSIPANQIH